MKIIKAPIKKHRTPTETGFKYPDGWDATKINVVAYEASDKLGDVEEYCIGLVHDDEYAKDLLKNKNIIEINEDETNVLGDKCKPQRLIVDEDKLPELLIILSKIPGQRSVKEQEMLDPDSDEPGIRKSPKFNIRDWFPDSYSETKGAKV